jgi:predicted nucleic acid-binding Zn ribbon protein
MTPCVKCGAPLAPDAQFCSKCGTPRVTQAAPVVPPQTQPQRSTWWIVPLVIVGLVIVAWLLLAGLPFGGEKKQVATVTTETIAEGTAAPAPAETGTVVEVGTVEEPPFVTQTAPPPLATQTIPTMTATPPVIVEQPVKPQPTPQPTPRPAPPVQTTPNPQPPREEPSGEISEAEATAALRNHLGAANPYDVSTSCLQLRSAGYRNVGYTYSVWDSCVEGGGSRMLGRWRVDAKTREVFRQGDDGRYLHP